MVNHWGIAGTAIIILLLHVECIKSQGMGAGARNDGQAGITTLSEDLWSVSGNPAGLGRIVHLSFGTGTEQKFLMKELGRYYFGVTAPVSAGCFGINIQATGYQQWASQHFSLGYGRSFGEKMLIGISLVYIHQKSGEPPLHLHLASFRLGFIVFASGKLSLGFSTFNPLQVYYKNKPYASLPGSIAFGLSYQPSSLLRLMGEFEKSSDHAPRFKAGIEINQKEIFFIRGGIRLFPLEYSFGAGFRYHRYIMDISSCYHQYLGFTPQISIQYDLK